VPGPGHTPTVAEQWLFPPQKHPYSYRYRATAIVILRHILYNVRFKIARALSSPPKVPETPPVLFIAAKEIS
jgi:hypothetical protein